MPKTEELAPDHWVLDRKIPIAVIVALVLQFVGTITYVVGLDNRVASLEKAITTSSVREGETGREGRQVLERLVRVEEKIGALLDFVRRLETAQQRRSEL